MGRYLIYLGARCGIEEQRVERKKLEWVCFGDKIGCSTKSGHCTAAKSPYIFKVGRTCRESIFFRLRSFLSGLMFSNE